MPAPNSHKRLRCVIRGEVQGVGFRLTACERARDLGLVGYVQNTPAGTVEVVAEGPESALDALKVFCYRGSDGARVDSVEVAEEKATGEFREFEVR